MQNVSNENDLIFMRMNVQVTYLFIPIVSHKDSFRYRGKSELGNGLFIHELLREPLIIFVISGTPIGLLLWLRRFNSICNATRPAERAAEMQQPIQTSKFCRM